MIYFDAAYVAKCYVNEAGSQQVAHLAATVAGVSSCELARLEFLATLRRHCREGKLSHQQFLQILVKFESDELTGGWVWLPVSSKLIRRACEQLKALPTGVYLRSVDALHLTCAKENGFADIHTNDRHMLAAASHFGLRAINILP